MTEKLEPPPEYKHRRWHWVERDGELEPMPWDQGTASWHYCGSCSPEYMHSSGWRYVGPCIPPGERGATINLGKKTGECMSVEEFAEVQGEFLNRFVREYRECMRIDPVTYVRSELYQDWVKLYRWWEGTGTF